MHAFYIIYLILVVLQGNDLSVCVLSTLMSDGICKFEFQFIKLASVSTDVCCVVSICTNIVQFMHAIKQCNV